MAKTRLRRCIQLIGAGGWLASMRSEHRGMSLAIDGAALGGNAFNWPLATNVCKNCVAGSSRSRSCNDLLSWNAIRSTTMISEIEQDRREIEALCRDYGVRRLAVFGSAATGGFRANSSDLDFLVVFRTPLTPGYANRYFGQLEGLQSLFKRRWDLVVESSIKNPYFRLYKKALLNLEWVVPSLDCLFPLPSQRGQSQPNARFSVCSASSGQGLRCGQLEGCPNACNRG
jgi:hypothetical protein